MSRRAILFSTSFLALTALGATAAVRAQHAAAQSAPSQKLRALQELEDHKILEALEGLGYVKVDGDEGLDQLSSLGYLGADERPYLGVSIAETDGEGVEIVEVIEGHGAAQAGLQAGDRLLAVDGQSFADFAGLSEALAEHRPGERVTVRVERAGETHEFHVALGSRPGSQPPVAEPLPGGQGGQDRSDWSEALDELRSLGYAAPDERPFLGVSIAETDGNGVDVIETVEGQGAAQAGIQAGDRLLAVDGHSFPDLAGLSEVMATHRPGETVIVRVERAGETLEFAVALGSRPGSQPPVAEPLPGGQGGQGGSDWSEALDELRSLGYAAPDAKPYLGVSIAETGGEGVEIVEVIDGHGAQRAGLQVGDRLLAIDGQNFADFAGLSEAVAAHRPGEAVTVRLERAGETQEFNVVLGARPDSLPSTPEPPPMDEDASGWAEELERQQDQAMEWADSFRARMDELRRDLDEHVGNLDGFVPRMRQQLEGRAQHEPATRELLEHLERFRAETQVWRDEHRAQLEEMQARMQEMRERHVEHLRSLGREARDAWRAREQGQPADAPSGVGGESDNARELRQRVEDLRRAVDELRRRLDEGGR